MREFSTLIVISLMIGFSTPAIAQLRPDRPTFFGDGEKQLEREIRRLNEHPNTSQPLLTIEDQNSQNSPENQNWVQLPGNLIALLPGSPTSQTTERVETSVGTLELTVLAASQNATQYILAYSPPLASTQFNQFQTLFNQIRDQLQKNSSVELTDDRPISLQNYPGRELSLFGKKQTQQFRLYIIKERLYILGISQGKEREISEQDVIRFFNSFQLNDP